MKLQDEIILILKIYIYEKFKIYEDMFGFLLILKN